MIELKNAEEIQKIRESGVVLKALFEMLGENIQAGMSTYDVDKLAHDFMKKNNVTGPCLGYYGYPCVTCISVNDTVIHGIPSKKIILKDGDLVSVDITLDKDGFTTDSTHTYEIGQVSKEVHDLNVRTREALYRGIEAAGKKGARVQDIAAAIENYIKPFGYGIVRDYCGHGVGFSIHEDPLIFNYVSHKNPNPKLREGMVIAIEPMITMGGDWRVRDMKDGWTVKTNDGSCACHWEHTVAITADGAEIMT